MKSRHESKKDHSLRKPLEDAVALHASSLSAEDVSKLVHEILSTLDEQNIIAYSEKLNVNLLTPHGRVLCLLLERPSLTIREMSVFLGVTEAHVIKSISKLGDDELIQRSKQNGRFEYSVIPNSIKIHPDIRRLFNLINSITSEK